jgi:membrane protein
MKRLIDLLRAALSVFTDAKAPTHAAAIAFFTVFSLAPLVALAVAIAGFFVGRAAAAGEIADVLETVIGPNVATFVSELAQTVAEQSSNATFTVLSIVVLFFGASAIFSQLKAALDDIWGVTESETLRGSILDTVRRRALAFVMIAVGGIALVLSVILEVVLSQLGGFLAIWWPNMMGLEPYLSWVIIPIVSFLVFVVTFKLLPDTRPAWREVLAGGVITTLLFLIGTVAIGFYLSRSGTRSLYGAAGSLFVILLWVYYSSWIVLFGASLTRVYGEALVGADGQVLPPVLDDL